ncbi:hypothetical protein JOC75_000155 [Metabacillus crassostreae]|uniref:hypothetical protein n=1 Tax=Metabacillus crassostreae TaxID=929098 RepID=UPI001956100C|nr:hypothetical protein [Metabacillus crassostreae]MBM7602185.1 hypothetical protein [Metabacillus crassostreae]
MDNKNLNEAVSNFSTKIKELKEQGATSNQIQAAVFEMIEGLGIQIPLEKINEKLLTMKNDNELK